MGSNPTPSADMKKEKVFVAFLRGINVGGHKAVKMEDLRRVFASLGFTSVKTLLNSGNVVFAASGSAGSLEKTIAAKLEAEYGYAINVMVRSMDSLAALEKADPFAGIKMTPDTRLYVTFLGSPAKSKLKIPYVSDEGDFRIVVVTDGEICSALQLSPKRGTVDVISFIEKEFGKQVTTRNWNTVARLLKTEV